MGERIVFLLPALHAWATGGNVYNRSLAGALDGRARVREWIWPRAAPGGAADLVLVDSLLLHEPGAIESARAAWPRARVALIAHYLRLLEAPGDGAAAEDRRRLAALDGVVATSAAAARALRAGQPASPPVGVVRPALADAFRAPRTAARERPPLLLSAGGLTVGKGWLHALDALESIRDLDWRWEAIGEDRLEPAFAERFRAAVAGSPVAGRVRLRGPVPALELARACDRASLLLAPSRFESFGMVAAEATARGLPVLAWRAGGIEEAVAPGDGAVLLAPGDAGALASTLRHLLERPEALESLARRAAARPEPRRWSDAASELLRFARGLPRPAPRTAPGPRDGAPAREHAGISRARRAGSGTTTGGGSGTATGESR